MFGTFCGLEKVEEELPKLLPVGAHQLHHQCMVLMVFVLVIYDTGDMLCSIDSYYGSLEKRFGQESSAGRDT